MVTNAHISIGYPSLAVSRYLQLSSEDSYDKGEAANILLDQLPDNSRDCFAREKHADYRDDMGGVGSFNRVNRTLYISKMQESPDKKQTEETLLRHFGEWGKIAKSEWASMHRS